MKTKYNYYRLVMFCVSICLVFCTFSIFVNSFSGFENTNAASWTTQTQAPTQKDNEGYTLINNEKQLAYLIANVSTTGKYRLTRNLDMSGYTWPGIGNSSSGTTIFKGTFDGQGFVISNITSETGFANQGLFASVSGATLKNISLSNCTFKGYSRIGSIAGTASGSTLIEKIVLTDCKVELVYKNSGVWANVGGVVGYAEGTTKIQNVFNNKGANGYVKSSVSNTNAYDIYMGGIVGLTQTNVIVKYCSNEVPITNTGRISNSHQLFAGGIIGWSYSNILLCGNTGAITAGNSYAFKSYAGGIAGCSKGTITDCYNRGNITAYAKENNITSESKLNDISSTELCSLESGFFAKKYTVFGSATVTKEGYREYAFAGGISGWSDKSTTRVYSVGTITGGGEYLKTVLTYKFVIKKYKKNFIGQWKHESDEGSGSQSINAQRCLTYTAPICGNVNNTSETTTYYNGTVQCHINSKYMEKPWTRTQNYVSESSTKWVTNATFYNSLGWDGKMHTYMTEKDMVYWCAIDSDGDVYGGVGTNPKKTEPVSNVSTHTYDDKETFSKTITVYDSKYSTTVKSTESSSIKTINFGDNWKCDTDIYGLNLNSQTRNAGYPYISEMYW